MGRSSTIPHRRAHGLCPVNGIRDLVHWRSGCDWSNEFLHGLGLGGGFAYLRVNRADPPRQVYWGIATPRPLEDLRPAWNVNVPGLGKRNRLAILDVPTHPLQADALIRKSIGDQCRTMLHPPVSMLGLPAMKKVSREIAHWAEELGEETAARCLRQVREYLNSPPDLEGDHLTAGRDIYVSFLREAGAIANLDLSRAIDRLRQSQTTIPELAEAIRQNDLGQAAACVRRIAGVEAEAYSELGRMAGASGAPTPG